MFAQSQGVTSWLFEHILQGEASAPSKDISEGHMMFRCRYLERVRSGGLPHIKFDKYVDDNGVLKKVSWDGKKLRHTEDNKVEYMKQTSAAESR